MLGMRRCEKPFAGLLAALTLLALPALAQRPEGARRAGAAGEQLITMDFQDVEIGVLAKFISEITGKNFILDEKVRGKVTVISPTKITVEEAYRVFQSILEVKGFTTVPSGPAIKIVPTREAKESGMPLAPERLIGDEFVTQIVPLSFTTPSQLVPVLQPMVSKDGLITAYDPANSLILIDSASNIERLLEIISELDIELPGRGIEVIRLENAFAEDVAQKVQQALEGFAEVTGRPVAAPRRPAPGQPPTPAGAPGQPTGAEFRVIADERTNSLIVLAQPAQIRTIRTLVKELDRKLEGVAKINVYRLKYANAIETVAVLSELIGGAGAGAAPGGGLGQLGTPLRRTTRGERLGERGRGRLGAGGLGQLGAALGEGGALPGQRGAAQPQAPASATGTGGEFVGEVRVTADPYTNSIIISAGPQDYDVLRRVLAEIDVPRRQVLVEAIIVEVSLDKARSLGIELQGGVPLENGIGIGRLSLDNLNTALSNPGLIQGLIAAAASKQTVRLPNNQRVPAQVALLTALQNDSDVNVLSAPTLLTSDNQEAEIVVAQNIPFIASRATDATNLQNTFTTVERQDVGITLRITPQISEGGVVRLDLYEEVSAVVANPPVNADIAGPTTTVRAASTTVIAEDGAMVAIGGLISDNVVHAESKIPYLGDIPFLGNLFKSTEDRTSKVNLLIFLTPRIVRDGGELKAASIDEREDFKENVRGSRLGKQTRDYLRSPKWEGPIAKAPPGPPAPLLYPEPIPPPPGEYPPAPRPYEPPPPPSIPPAAVAPPSALYGLPETGHRFVVLLSYWEQGKAPPALETVNGFLTIYAPEDGVGFFVKGGTYEYASPSYQAKYTCLEVFPSAGEALAVYPEGQPVEGGPGIRWRPFSAEQLRQMAAGQSPWKRAG